jgi:hypothetical protein
MKITMLGKSGAGKTSFLAGLYEVLGAQSRFDFQLTPRGDELVDSLVNYGAFQHLSFTDRGRPDFPAGHAPRNKPDRWSFDLLYGLRPVEAVEWLDYRGAILDDPASFDLELAELTEVLNHLQESHMAVIFVDSFLLTGFADLNQARTQTGASLFNHILQSFGQKFPRKHLVCLIVLTKVDALQDPYWVEDDYNELILRAKDAFEPILQYTRSRRRWATGIVPVTVVGAGNASYEFTEEPNDPNHPGILVTKLDQPPQPERVDQAFFFCVQEAFRNYRRTALAELADLTGKIAAVQNEQRRRHHDLPAEPGDKPAGHVHQWELDHQRAGYLYAGYSHLIDELTRQTLRVVTRV